MRRMDLDDLEPRSKAAFGCIPELRDHVINIIHGHFSRYGKAVGKGDGTRCERLPSALIRLERPPVAPRRVGRCLAPGVGELDSGNRSLFGDEFGDQGKCLGVFVRPDTAVIRADPAFATDSCRLHHDEGCAAHGTAPQVNKVPVRRHPLPARILAHGRDEDAVLKFDPAQGEW